MDASNMYTVTIETAQFDEMPRPRRSPPHPLTVSGSVASSNKSYPATNVTIVLNRPGKDAITIVTNLPTTPPATIGQPSTYFWSEPLPDGKGTLPEGSSVTVFSNRQSQATKPILITS